MYDSRVFLGAVNVLSFPWSCFPWTGSLSAAETDALLHFFASHLALSSLSFNISDFDKIKLSFIGVMDFLGQNYDYDPYDPYDQISLNLLKDSFPVSRFECLGLSTTGKQAP